MGGQKDFKSRIISNQKPLKRRKRSAKSRSKRNSIDLMGIPKRTDTTKKRFAILSKSWFKGALFVAAVPCFFMIGYSVAALPLSTGMKALILIPIAIVGLVLSYIVASLAR